MSFDKTDRIVDPEECLFIDFDAGSSPSQGHPSLSAIAPSPSSGVCVGLIVGVLRSIHHLRVISWDLGAL